jgi:putative ATP-binding cassette transporter
MRGMWGALLAIWRLTYPYFVSRDVTELRLWPLPRFRLQERWVAITLAVVVIGIEFAQVGINVRLSYFSRDWFNAIQEKNAAAFWSLLLTVFCFWAAIFIASAILQYVLQSYLQIGWRRWMTQRYTARWLGGHAHYTMQLSAAGADNPDQRIQEDVDGFIQRTVSLTLRVLSAVSNLISFSVILWGISAAFSVPGTDWKVPGFLVWGALIYSALATWITHLIGRPLIRLNFEQQRYEADFRFSLARLREYGEQVALLGGETAERDRLGQRFGRVINNFLAIVSRQKKLIAFTASYSQINVVIPYILVAPYYFSGQIMLGGMQQAAGAFARVESTMSFFITLYTTLAEYKAIVDRLTGFDRSIVRATEGVAAEGEPARALRLSQDSGTALRVEAATLALPDGRRIVRVGDLALRSGESVLVTGPSGSGKSTLFRAVAGIWPFGEGQITVPGAARMMLLPQRPYVPAGTLRAAITYPALEGSYDDAAIAAALAAAQLPALADKLDEERLWTQTLSLGEQQRLAVARAILARPDWLFLDEATAALDEPTEAAIYRALAELLPGTTIVSIGHRSTLIVLHQRHIAMQAGTDGLYAPQDVRTPEPA